MESYISFSITVVEFTLEWNIDRVKSNKESYTLFEIHKDCDDGI